MRRRLLRSFAVLFVAALAVAATVVARRPVTPHPRESFFAVPSPATLAPPGPAATLRFVALGDTGKGNEAQFRVGRAMKQVCEARGSCAFGLLLGDNLYPSGPADVDDPIFVERFEKPYGSLPFRFWVALGNHDYGGDGRGTEFFKGQVEVDYSKKNPRWRLPAAFYTFTHGPADFVVLDTNPLFLADFSSSVTDALSDLGAFSQRAADQADGLGPTLSGLSRPWRIAVGHHPYFSNGRHGNAGSYDGVPGGIPGSGAGFQRFFETRLCGRVDVYLSAHDHNLQDLGSRCGTQLLVSGGGATATSIQGAQPAPYSEATEGFLLVEASERELAFTFFDADARQRHSRTLTKPASEPARP
jgi:hypothetical protein